MPLPKLVCDCACQVGEGPLWHPEEARLYWCDILTKRLFRCDPLTSSPEVCLEGMTIGGFTLQRDGSLLLFSDEGAVHVWREGVLERTIIERIDELAGKRFNDVIADPEGRVFCGTLGDHTKQDDLLYRLDPDGSIHVVLEGVGTSNGMGFSPDLKKFYFTDTTIDTIWVFDYDSGTGSISNRREFINLSEEEIKPDGMTVDTNGDVWSAMALGGCLIRIAHDGSEKERVPFPVQMVTSLIFGGEKLDRMYVTTGMGHERGPKWGDLAGSVFEYHPSVAGAPEFRSNIGIDRDA